MDFCHTDFFCDDIKTPYLIVNIMLNVSGHKLLTVNLNAVYVLIIGD